MSVIDLPSIKQIKTIKITLKQPNKIFATSPKESIFFSKLSAPVFKVWNAYLTLVNIFTININDDDVSFLMIKFWYLSFFFCFLNKVLRNNIFVALIKILSWLQTAFYLWNKIYNGKTRGKGSRWYLRHPPHQLNIVRGNGSQENLSPEDFWQDGRRVDARINPGSLSLCYGSWHLQPSISYWTSRYPQLCSIPLFMWTFLILRNVLHVKSNPPIQGKFLQHDELESLWKSLQKSSRILSHYLSLGQHNLLSGPFCQVRPSTYCWQFWRTTLWWRSRPIKWSLHWFRYIFHDEGNWVRIGVTLGAIVLNMFFILKK